MKTTKHLANLYPLTNKQVNLDDYIKSFLNRTLTMFAYTNLPDSLPRYVLERTLQVNGYATVYKYQGKLLVTTGNLHGQEKSPYNEPTQVTINVPALQLNQELTINKDCAVIKNDDLMNGLIPTLSKHGTLIVENEITLLLKDYNARIQTLISGGSDQTINSANKFLNNIIDGNLTTVAESNFLKDLSVHNAQTQGSSTFQDLLQYQQYLKSDLLSELGINTNTNMKKERLITSEVDNDSEQTYPLIDNMLQNRKEGINMVNKLFNGEIMVDYNGAWKDKADQRNTPDQQDEPDEQPENKVDEPEPKTEPKPEPKQVQPNDKDKQSEPDKGGDQ